MCKFVLFLQDFIKQNITLKSYYLNNCSLNRNVLIHGVNNNIIISDSFTCFKDDSYDISISKGLLSDLVYLGMAMWSINLIPALCLKPKI